MNDLEIKIRNRIEELKKDERLTYKTATVYVNAPLALIQCSSKARIWELEDLIGAERTVFPIEREGS